LEFIVLDLNGSFLLSFNISNNSLILQKQISREEKLKNILQRGTRTHQKPLEDLLDVNQWNLPCKEASGKYFFRRIIAKLAKDEVSLLCSEKRVCIKVSEAARILKINRAEIVSAIHQNTFGSLFIEKTISFKLNSLFEEQFEEQLKNYLSKNNNITLELVEKTLTIWQKALEISKQLDKEQFSKPCPSKLYVKVNILNEGYLVDFENLKSSEKIAISTIFELGEILGKGANGQVFAITNIFTNQKLAYKYAIGQNLEKLEKAKNQIRNECTALKNLELNFENSIGQIQKPPELVGVFAEKQPNTTSEYEIGCIGERYTRNYKQELNLLSLGKIKNFWGSEEQWDLFFDFYQVIDGMVKILEMGSHEDIKPANILVHETFVDGKTRRVLYISDFGGFRFFPSQDEISDPTTNKRELAGKLSLTRMFTRNFSSYYDKAEIIQLLKKEAFDEKDLNTIIEIEKKLDVFSLGCLMYKALTGQEFPSCKVEGDKTHYWANIFDRKVYVDIIIPEMEKAGIPSELQILLFTMLAPEHKNRPTIETVRSSYIKMMKEVYKSQNPNKDKVEQRFEEMLSSYIKIINQVSQDKNSENSSGEFDPNLEKKEKNDQILELPL
jgi:serine/threonine protein kinase